jgi:hypothetical protein
VLLQALAMLLLPVRLVQPGAASLVCCWLSMCPKLRDGGRCVA